MLQSLSWVFKKAGSACHLVARKLYRSPMERRSAPWFAAQGDKTLRLDYDLDENAVVFDLGGYEGQWASDIFAKYGCTVYVFEALPEFAENIRRRFAKNPKIRVFPFGLSDAEKTPEIALTGDASSTYKRNGTLHTARLARASEFLQAQDLRQIDLMKINIEGGEYDLLEHLIETGWIKRIVNLQVQFHDFVPDAERRMQAIQARLALTHTPTYQFPFVWENWRRT